jgi:hypothetical protein
MVVAIALATGFTYEESLSACTAVNPSALHDGMTMVHTRKALALLGFRVVVRKKFEIDKATGILWVENKKKDQHVAYLWAGRVVEPRKADRTALWLDPEDYLKAGDDGLEWKARVLITLEEKE